MIGSGGFGFKFVGCRRIVRVVYAARAGRRVSVGGRIGSRFFGGFFRALNSRFRIGTDKGNSIV